MFVSFCFPAFGSGDCHSGIGIVDSWSRFELGADEHKISIKSLTFKPSGGIKGVEARGKSGDHPNVVIKPTDEKGLLKWSRNFSLKNPCRWGPKYRDILGNSREVFFLICGENLMWSALLSFFFSDGRKGL